MPTPTAQRLRSLALAALAAAAPALVLAHTGTDGGVHHNFLDRMLWALSDLGLPALVAVLGIWGPMTLAKHLAAQRKARALRAIPVERTHPRDGR